MKTFLSLLLIFIAVSSYAQFEYEGNRVVGTSYEFEEGSTQLLYGNNVTLRKKPSMDAIAIDTLKIGTKIKIIEKTDEPVTIYGRATSWYKVKCSAGTGYIAGGLIAQDSREINGGIYLVAIAGDYENRKGRVRFLKDGAFYGKEFPLNNDSFFLTAYDNRGLEGIESMLVINLFAEACGVDGGKTYIFNDGEKLYRAIHCYAVADGGYYFGESLQFPEEIGWGNYIYYERESSEPMNEDYTWSRAIVNRVTLEWKDGKLEPDVKKMKFEED